MIYSICKRRTLYIFVGRRGARLAGLMKDIEGLDRVRISFMQMEDSASTEAERAIRG
jgi:hypothetical protein